MTVDRGAWEAWGALVLSFVPLLPCVEGTRRLNDDILQTRGVAEDVCTKKKDVPLQAEFRQELLVGVPSA